MPFFGGGASVDLASPPAIGNTTPNTGAFTTLNTSNIFGSGSPDGGVAIRNTSTATNFVEFITGVGFFKNANNIIASINRSSTKSFVTTSDGFFGWGSSTTNADAATPNASLFSDAANILAQRKGTNAQTFRIYNTFTDASNYERGFFRWNTNVLEIGAEAAGTGINRTVRISTYDTIDFRNTQYGYSMGSVAGGLWTLNNGPQIVNVCRMESNYGFQLASTKTLGWVSGTNMALAPDTALYRNAAGVIEVNNGTAGTFRDLIVRNFRMSAPTGVPTANNSTGTEGSIRWDADYIYICTATNTWKRVAIATWP